MRTLIFFAAVGLITGCYYDNIEEVHPDIGMDCDTSTVVISYAGDIVPILNSGCGTGDIACHNTDNSDSEIGLETYAGVAAQISPNNVFLKSIIHDPSASAMPKGGGKLDDCSIMKIESWINHGYTNN